MACWKTFCWPVYFSPHKNSTDGCRRRKINWRMVWTKYSCTSAKVSKSLASAFFYCLPCLPPLPTQCPINVTTFAIPKTIRPTQPPNICTFCSNSSLKYVSVDICLGVWELYSLVPVYVEAQQDSFSLPPSCRLQVHQHGTSVVLLNPRVHFPQEEAV